jgi:hypothetical protein
MYDVDTIDEARYWYEDVMARYQRKEITKISADFQKLE